MEGRYLKFRIPPDAKLEDVIEVLNLMDLTINVNSKETKMFLEIHKDWIIAEGLEC